MAKGKKTENKIDNEFKFNSSLDFDDLDFEVDPFKDDRKPANKIRDGLKSGVQSRIKNASFIRGVLKDILPRGFGQTMDLADSVATTARQIYSDSLKEVRPALGDFKRASSKLIPENNKYLPEGLKNLLKGWKEEDARKKKGTGALDDQRSESIAIQLGQIFEQQAVQEEKNRRETSANEKLREGIEITRHRDLFSVLNHSAISLSEISQYQTNINLKFQKKSLELQHRQVFTLYDILDTLNKTHALQSDSYEKIVKNTGLPDWQKIKFKELSMQRLYEKVTGAGDKVVKGMFPSTDEYLQMTARRIQAKVKTSVKSNIQAFRSGLSEAEVAAEMAGGSGGPDKLEAGAATVGDEAAGALGSMLAKKLKGPLKDFIPSLVKASDYLENFNENFIDTLEKFRRDKRWAGTKGIKGMLIRGAQTLLPPVSADRTFARTGAKDLSTEKPFTFRTDRSINEIIPGYLARILQEMQILRTGNPNIDLVDYDQDKGKFTSATKVLKSISEDLFPQTEISKTKELLDSILNRIDPKQQLNEKQREELSKKLFKNKLQANEPYTDLTGRAGRLTRAYLAKLEEEPGQKLDFTRDINKLVRGASDPREKIEAYLEQGRQNELLKLGIITKRDDDYVLDIDQLFSGKLGNSPFEMYQNSRKKNRDEERSKRARRTSGASFDSSGVGATNDECKCEPYLSDIIARLDTSINYYQSIEEILKSGVDFNFKREKTNKSSPVNTAGATAGSIFEKGKGVQEIIKDKFADFRNKATGFNKADVAGNMMSMASLALNPFAIPSMLASGAGGKIASAASDKILGMAASRIKQNYFTKDPSTIWNGIYIQGELEPRITANKLKAGYYANLLTDKPIKDISEIDAPIRDVDTGEVVIKMEELGKLLVKTNDGKMKPLNEFLKAPLLNGGMGDKETAKWFFNKIKDRADTGATKMWNELKNKVDPFAKRLTEQAKDVWVEGEKYPRMTAMKMYQGHYTDAATGDTIYLPSDIKGEVKDNTGKTVISLEELDSLMVWDSGQKRFAPIRKLLRGIGKIYGGFSWYYKKIGIPLTKFNFRMIGKTAKLGSNLARLTVGKGPLSVKDVYVGDETRPRLYAAKIRNGDYYNKSNGKPFYHQSDINGEVVNGDGVTVLSDEDLPNLRVYDSLLKLLNPFRPLKWLLSATTKAASWTVKKGLKATKFLTRKIGSAIGSFAGGFIRYISKPEDVYVKGEASPRLKAILMKAGRYVSEKTGLTIFLPSDIDGPVWDSQEKIRVLDKDDLAKGLVKEDGTPLKATMMQNVIKGIKSINKLFSRRIKLNPKDTPVPNSPFRPLEQSAPEQTVSLLGDIKNLFEDYFTEKKVKGDTDGDGDREGSWEDIKARREADKAKRDAGKSGESKKDTEKKGGLMGLLAGALDAITGFLGGFKTLFKAGGVLGGLGKLLGVGRAAGTVAAAAGGMGTLGTLGAGLAAVVTNPVVLGIAGAALVGYGAYKGYKSIRKWMSKPSTLDTIRYTQYGFKKDNTSFFSKIVDLEEYMKEFVKIGSEQATLDEKKMDIDEMMSIFGFSSKDNEHKRIYGTWYIKRFKPVYLTHVSALNMINGSTDLSKINDLKKEEKLKYIEATKFSSGPYTVTTLPVLDGSVTAATGADVNAAVEAALKEFSTQPGGSKSTGTGLPTDTKKPEDLKSNGRLDYGKTDAGRKLPGASVTGSSAIGAAIGANAVSAFDTVRYKTYGLKELEKGKVVSLIMLESLMAKKVSYQGTKATFDGNPNELLEKVTTYFGIPDLFSEAAVAWTKWFRDRFLPVYLNYATLHMQSVNKAPKSDSAPVLDPNQQYDIALALSATGGAWRVTDTPWEGYELNTNPDTVKSNLEYLKEAVKQKTLREEQAKEDAKKQPPGSSPVKSAAVKAFQASRPEYNPPTSGSVSASSTAPTWDRAGPAMSAGMGTGPTTDGMNGVKPDPTVKVPEPTGGLEGMKQTVAAAAKVVGIDPNIMLTTAAIESDFNPNAKAKSSSATGLMQFLDKTWLQTVERHGKKYGYDKNTSRLDPKASAIMGAHYIQDSLKELSGSYKGAIGSVEAYLVHFMGPTGAKMFLKAMQENPGQYGSQLMPKEASANTDIYFGKNGPRTLAEIYQLFYNKLRVKAARYGINLPASSGADTSEKSKYVMPGAGQNTGVVSEANKPNGNVTPITQEAPKSSYNPTARPTAMQQQAVQASRQASTPLSDAVGFNPKAMGSGTETMNANKNTLTADIMKNTESILSQSLDVQKETLDVMKMIYEKINNIKAPDAAPKSEAKQYEAPKAPVPMRKSA